MNGLETRGPGPRGIDCVDDWTGLPYTLQSTQYPFYACHGNNVGSVSRSGSGSYSLGGERVYDAWGVCAYTANDSAQRYCANLGHRQDDETGTYTGGSADGDGLVTMRARYYEPGTGRFVSEDKDSQGRNWYAYCLNQPTNLVDESGNSPKSEFFFWLLGEVLFSIFKVVLPDSAEMRCAKAIIQDMLGARAAFAAVLAAGEMDAKVRAAAIGAAQLMTLFAVALAVHQLIILAMLTCADAEDLLGLAPGQAAYTAEVYSGQEGLTLESLLGKLCGKGGE